MEKKPRTDLHIHNDSFKWFLLTFYFALVLFTCFLKLNLLSPKMQFQFIYIFFFFLLETMTPISWKTQKQRRTSTTNYKITYNFKTQSNNIQNIAIQFIFYCLSVFFFPLLTSMLMTE